jgi:hypothetical protein
LFAAAGVAFLVVRSLIASPEPVRECPVSTAAFERRLVVWGTVAEALPVGDIGKRCKFRLDRTGVLAGDSATMICDGQVVFQDPLRPVSDWNEAARIAVNALDGRRFTLSYAFDEHRQSAQVDTERGKARVKRTVGRLDGSWEISLDGPAEKSTVDR